MSDTGPMSPPRDDDPIEAGGHYDGMVNSAAELFRTTLWQLHKANIEAGLGTPDGSANGAPLIQGAVGGLVAFMIEGLMPDERIEFLINDTVKHILPQMRIDWEAHKAGAVGGGTA